MDSHQFALFIPTALLLALAPGPDNLGVLALGVSSGLRASLGFALGCAAGCLNHTLLSVIGLTALLSASPLALQALKIAGALYLAWIGLQSLKQARRSASPLQHAGLSKGIPQAFGVTFRRGLLANALNPKVALFFLAFLPQFITPGGWTSPVQLAVLGISFALCSASVFVIIALGSGRLGDLLKRSLLIHRGLEAVSGLVFIGLALRLASADLTPMKR